MIGQNIDKFRILSLGYVFGVAQIALFVLLKQINVCYDLHVLWISVLSVIFLIIGQIYLMKEDGMKWKITLFEILLFCFLMHLLFVPTYGLPDSDPQYEFGAMNLISTHAWSLNMESRIYMPIGGFTDWPMLSMITIVFSEITNVSLLDSARYLPSVFSTVALLFMFYTSLKICREKRSSLLYMLLFSLSYGFLQFNSMFNKSSYAFVLFFAAIYSYFASRSHEKEGVGFRQLRLLAILFGLSLVLSHHLTIFMLSLFFIAALSFMVFFKAVPKIVSRFVAFDENPIKLNFAVLITVACFGFWLYLTITPLGMLVFSVKNFFSAGEYLALNPPWGGPYLPLEDLRTIIYLWSLRLTFLFGIIILLHIFFRQRRKIRVVKAMILAYAGIMGFMYLGNLYGVITRTVYPERFMTFGWAFLLMILSSFLVFGLHMKKTTFFKVACIAFIVFYVTMNLTAINPVVYDIGTKPQYENGVVRDSFLPQEYAIVDWFEGGGYKGRIQTDRILADLLVQRIRAEYRTIPQVFKGDLDEVGKSNWMIIRNEMFHVIKPTLLDRVRVRNETLHLAYEVYQKFNQAPLINRVYSNGEVEVFNIGQWAEQ